MDRDQSFAALLAALRAPSRHGSACFDVYNWCDENRVNVSRGDGLICLKYAHDADQRDPLVRHCRGLVLDEATLDVVCRPYDKFHNLGEPGAADIDWESARVLEKLDGTMFSLYVDRRPAVPRWRVATLGHPTAGGSYNVGSTTTYERAFMESWARLRYRLPQIPPSRDADLWYFFEFCAPDNRVVVRYPEPRIVLHGGRRGLDMRELGQYDLYAAADEHGWELVDCLDCIADAGREGVIEAAEDLDPLEGKGYVVVDGSFNRVKVKSPRYVLLHQMREGRTPRRILDVVRRGESEVDEVLTYFPEYRAEFESFQDRLGELVARLGLEYIRWLTVNDDPFADRKAFAARVKDLPASAVLFLMHTERFSDPLAVGAEVRRRLLSLKETPILRALGYKEAP